MAPRCAEPTSAAYFSSTPVTGARYRRAGEIRSAGRLGASGRHHSWGSKAKMKLGYIGIGLMGRPMTLRLLAAGHEVTVWNRSRDKLAAVVEKGAKAAE